MDIKNFLKEMKKIQTNLIDYLDHEDNKGEKYQNLINLFDEIKIHGDHMKIKPLLYLILNISNNCHRKSEFLGKIFSILQIFKDEMKKYFSNIELFHIFKSNKRLLLFLHEENMMTMDESIVNKFRNNKKYKNEKYQQYFQPEIQSFNNEKNELPDNFFEKRKIGENDNVICKIIQKDLVKDFIIYINKNCCQVNSTINSSIYETNNFLLKKEYVECKEISLIEYAAFFGSIQIFNYLFLNGAEIKPSLWIYAVHGQNPDIIHCLEANKISPSQKDNVTFEQIFYESIKCHHINIANYILNNYLQNEIEYSNDTLINSLKYYNFMFIQSDIVNETSFYYLCKYDHYLLTLLLLKKIDIDINKKQIYIGLCLMKFKIMFSDLIQYHIIQLHSIFISFNIILKSTFMIQFTIISFNYI